MFKNLRKTLIAGVCAIIVASACVFNFTDSLPADADGVAEIAMELNSGKILHEKSVDVKLPMASTTKIMTALIIAEDCDLTETITVPNEAVGVEGSSIYLKYDEVISVKDLLYGLMLRSGNDAACALAIHHSGSVNKFVERMNTRATELGAKNTHFKNPSGLPAEEHYTTARDLCNIARAAMANEVFATVVGTKYYSGDFRQFANKNKLIGNFDGANGVKTGYTEKAGRCLVSSAKRGNMDVVCVVLNCYDMFERSKSIIDGCFDKYAIETLSKESTFEYNGRICRLDNDYDIVIKKQSDLKLEITAPETDSSEGAVARLKIFCENDLIFSRDLFTIN